MAQVFSILSYIGKFKILVHRQTLWSLGVLVMIDCGGGPGWDLLPGTDVSSHIQTPLLGWYVEFSEARVCLLS